jgi:hypothetical protein
MHSVDPHCGYCGKQRECFFIEITQNKPWCDDCVAVRGLTGEIIPAGPGLIELV